VRTERAWFLSAGEESEVRTGADFLAGEISVLTIPYPSPFSIQYIFKSITVLRMLPLLKAFDFFGGTPYFSKK
jgi:hypothetical protein